MPWCDPCDKYLAPNALSVDGGCPTCSTKADTQDMKTETPVKAPWHFWLMIAALVLYLGWRLIQFGIWAVQSI